MREIHQLRGTPGYPPELLEAMLRLATYWRRRQWQAYTRLYRYEGA